MSSESSDSDDSSGDHEGKIEEAAAAMEEHLGIHVEPSEDPWDFIAHLATAAKNHKAGKDQAKEDIMGQGPQTGAGATPPGQQPGANEEQRPYLMSTGGEKLFLSTVVTIPLDRVREDQRGTAKVAQKGYRKDCRKHREELNRKIDACAANGIPKADCDVLRKAVNDYKLSVDDAGEYHQQILDERINTALKVAKHFKGGLMLSTMLGATQGVHEVQRPAAGPNEDGHDELLKLAQQRGAAMSVGQHDKNGNGAK